MSELLSAHQALRFLPPDPQGLPLGSGLGSSAASAAAGAMAVNALFGAPLDKAALVPAGLASEAAVSGYHADNIAPALLGGFIMIRRCPAHCAGSYSAASQYARAAGPSSCTS